MSRLFITPREIDFISDIAKEITKDVIGDVIYYYKVREDISNVHDVYEEALEKLNTLTPESVEVIANSNYIEFDISGMVDNLYDDLGITWEISSLHDKIYHDDYDYELYYGADYFDGYEEGLEIELKSRIDGIVSNNLELKDDFIKLGLEFNFTTIKDLLETYDVLDDIANEISTEFGEAENRAIGKEGEKIGNKMGKILNVNASKNEISIHPRALIMYIHGNEFFTTDPDEFKDNITNLLNELYSDYNFPEDTDQFFEWTREVGYGAEDIDEDYLNSGIISKIEYALNEYLKASYEGEEDDVNIGKLKSEIISHLNDTLVKLGESPNAKVIQNDVTRIFIDRDKFKLNGQVYITLTTSDGKSQEGYVNINDIPTYFTNYKLFEAIQRFKSII